MLKVHKSGNRYFVVLPPVPAVMRIAERGRASFSAEIVAENCQNKEFDGKIITFSRKVTVVRRSNGSAWYRLMLPAIYSYVWKSVEGCGSVKLDVLL
jgi:hypothetical protein